MSHSDYDRIYRQNGPNKGRRCRIVASMPQRKNWLGSGELYMGDAMVGVEFEDGRREMVQRQAVVLANSRLGRQAVRAIDIQTPEQRAERNTQLATLRRRQKRERGP